MIISMLISLYTARIILQTLGVVDYGIYGVVGGVLGMFSFLNISMSGATSRFLTFELGRNDCKRLKLTFGSSIIVHIIIAFIITILCETIGVWFLNEKLVIPTERLVAAHWVFQFSIISMILSVVGVPFNASVFSHERMDIYAYIEICNSLLRLLVVYLLLIGDFDKLILYAGLSTIASLLSFMAYSFYCVRNFNECRPCIKWDKGITRQMLSFSGWDLYGNLSVMARTQGVNMLLNMYFGPVMNAASDISTRVQAVISNLSNNVATASRPQIVKNYSQDKHWEMIALMRDCSRITFVLMMFLSVPLMVEIHYVLDLWLGVIPDNTEIICILTLLWNLAVAMNTATNYGVQATGKVKFVSFVSGTLFLLVIPVTYILFSLGYPFWIPFVYNLATVILCPIVGGWTLKQNLRGYSIMRMMIPDLVRDWIALMIVVYIVYYIHTLIATEGFLRLLLVCTVSTIIIIPVTYFIVFPAERRLSIREFLINRIWKRDH